MPLHEETIILGNKLFRWRSYLPLIFLLTLIPAYWDLKAVGTPTANSLSWGITCFTLAFAGLLIRALTIGYTPLRTSGRNTKKQLADKLNTDGIYSLVRNPLYLGNFFMVIGVMLYVGIWYAPLIYALGFWLYYERIIFAEESYLRGKFGDEYISWADHTPAFWPRLHGWRAPELPFSLRMVIKREHNGLLAMVTVFSLLDGYKNWALTGHFQIQTIWLWALAAAFGIFMLVELLRRFTSLLKTGRS